MGDVGSGFLGFAIGILAYVNVAEGLLATWSWLILLGIFLVDATITLIRRFLRRARWHEAHRSHAYQHAVRRWKSHGKVSCGVAVINAFWLLPLAWLASVHPAIGWILAFIAMLPLVGLAFWLDAGIEEENVSA